jgi:hypothetical protein
MVAPELHMQRWQRIYIIDGGVSQLWWWSWLELVGCMMR